MRLKYRKLSNNQAIVTSVTSLVYGGRRAILWLGGKTMPHRWE